MIDAALPIYLADTDLSPHPPALGQNMRIHDHHIVTEVMETYIGIHRSRPQS